LLNGFLEVGLRSYADGCDGTHPVGYLEVWYLAESHRRHGVGATSPSVSRSPNVPSSIARPSESSIALLCERPLSRTEETTLRALGSKIARAEVAADSKLGPT
jgi:hypothetical protein